ncbi:SGNH/GDSL hydrolase family protein, partial [Campylobacter fetus]|uniref:SGNH/GDSL hydrolase family protein n=1 Tax=Campylobacter fetus TaxID=196 RepID=UPI00143D9C5F
MRILIYAYGFIGKNNYEFMKQFVDEVYVYDDMLSELNYQKQFIKTLKNSKFDSILVSVANKNTYKNIKDNLSEIFPENIIHFAPIFMEKPSDLFLNFISNKFDLNLIKNFDLEKIQNRLKELKTIYFEFRANFDKEMLNKRKSIDEKYADLDIFGKLYKTSSINTKTFNINYPGFSVSYNANCDSRSFYFKDKIDFEKLQNRDKKLVIVFGNCGLRADYLDEIGGGNIVQYLQKYLPNYTVLNLGINGSTLFEQINIYNALFYTIKPEFVLTVFGGAEYIEAFVQDQILLKRHSIIYAAMNNETTAKELYKSDLPIHSDFVYTIKKRFNPENSAICKALYERLIQFYNIVNSNNGKFIALLQPFAIKKINLDEDEKTILLKDSLDEIIAREADEFIDEFNKTTKNLSYYFDLNKCLCDEINRCFYGTSLHYTPYASEK